MQGVHCVKDGFQATFGGHIQPVNDEFGVFEGLRGAGIGCLRLNVLTDHDHAQEDELQERLRDPRDDRRRACPDRVGEADQVEQAEGLGAPHAADDLGDQNGEPRVEPVHDVTAGQVVEGPLMDCPA